MIKGVTKQVETGQFQAYGHTSMYAFHMWSFYFCGKPATKDMEDIQIAKAFKFIF